jgi:hypothetical protein
MSTSKKKPIWVAIEPQGSQTRILLSVAGEGVKLKARLPVWPAQPGAVVMLLEALAHWYGQPLHAVIDADAEDVRRSPERWARALGDVPEHVHVQWVGVPQRRRDDFLAPLGDCSSAQRLLSYAATGRR